MTFWPLTNSDYPTNQIFHQFHDLDTDFDLHRITSGFHGAFATDVACQQGTLTLPDTWFRPPFSDLLMLQLLRPNSSNLPCLYSTFHLEYPLVLSRFCLDSWRAVRRTVQYLGGVVNRPQITVGLVGSGTNRTSTWIHVRALNRCQRIQQKEAKGLSRSLAKCDTSRKS